MSRIAVGDIMTRKFFSVHSNDSLLKCSKEMVKNRVNSLLVVDKKRLLGIITSTDILWAITKKQFIDLRKIDCIDVATKKVAVIKPSASINQALNKMRSLNFRRLPVISKGELLGVLTLKDILRVEPSLYLESGELVQIREEERKLKNTAEEWPSEGFCDNCNTFAELLKVHDTLLCPDCREELF
jgi:CBS domain-containing protein